MGLDFYCRQGDDWVKVSSSLFFLCRRICSEFLQYQDEPPFSLSPVLSKCLLQTWYELYWIELDELKACAGGHKKNLEPQGPSRFCTDFATSPFVSRNSAKKQQKLWDGNGDKGSTKDNKISKEQ